MQTILGKSSHPGADMRTRYVPGVRFKHGVLRMAPWFDMALVILYVILLHSRIVLQPGVVVELPAAQSARGLISPLIAVAMMTGSSQGPVCRVFFDNEQYIIDDHSRFEALRTAMNEERVSLNETALTLYADKRVSHSDLVRLMQLAQEAGMKRINLGTQPLDSSP